MLARSLADVERRVLVVSSLNLDLNEVSLREGARLLYTPDSVSAPNFASRMPAPVDLSKRLAMAGDQFSAGIAGSLPGTSSSESDDATGEQQRQQQEEEEGGAEEAGEEEVEEEAEGGEEEEGEVEEGGEEEE
eukprot:COSAG05_NODE_11353_length_517_cov_1.504785_1_plen_133_part_00